MYLILPFRAEDAYRMELQAAQKFVDGYATPEELQAISQAVTVAVDGGSEPLICAGRVPTGSGWEIWTFLSKNAGGHLTGLTKIALRLLTMCDGHVITYVDDTFPQGHRWAKIMGLQQAGVLFGFLPEGTDAAIYVRGGN